ncbi:MAG: YceH family protein [Thiohalocapsa sp.]|jgi:hypothetical protein
MSEEQNAGEDSSSAMLDPLEARVLGCLMEKQRTTPDQYPLTLNALVSACNQKTSRAPVMHLEVGQVGHVVNGLRDRGLIHASFSGRTERYDHKMVGAFMLDRRQQAVLCALLLRGPQTPGELRTNAARLAEFNELADVHRTLEEMARRDLPLVRELPRQSGMREQRYAHLLCGEPQIETPAPKAAQAGPVSADLEERVRRLEAEVAELRAEIATLHQDV